MGDPHLGINSEALNMINLLFSRPYIKGHFFRILEWLSQSVDMRLLIDCGAYTDFMAGRAALPISKYIAWLREIVPQFEKCGTLHGYFALDVIGDADATRRNYEAMLDAGLRPIPIVTRGTPEADIQRMVETAPSVALGGIFGTTIKERSALRWMIGELPEGYDAHWLGFTDEHFVRFYQPDSLDSSNWKSANRYGALPMYMGDLAFGRRLKHGMTLRKSESRVIRSHAFDPALLRFKKHWRPGRTELAQCIQNTMMLKYMRDLEPLAVKFFFACPGITPIEFNLLYQYANGGDNCIGFPIRKTILRVMEECDTLQDVTPEIVGTFCEHY